MKNPIKTVFRLLGIGEKFTVEVEGYGKVELQKETKVSARSEDSKFKSPQFFQGNTPVEKS